MFNKWSRWTVNRDCTILFWTLVCILCIPTVIGHFASNNQESSLVKGFSKSRIIYPRVVLPEHEKDNKRVRREIKSEEIKILNGTPLDRITIEIPLENKNYIVDLFLNRNLLPKGYFEKSQKNGNKSYITKNPTLKESELCHYKGKIKDVSDSWVAVSLCHGISGALYDGEEIHHFEPTENSHLNWETNHYKESEYVLDRKCGNNNTEIKHHFERHLNTNQRAKRSVNDVREPYNSNEKSRYLEMVIVVDNNKYKELGGDLPLVYRRVKDISNVVNALFEPFNIFIALTGVVVWTEVNEITITNSGNDTLNNFLHYRKERLMKTHPNDNAQLITSQFADGVVGKAMQGPICSYAYSGGVNSDHNAMVGQVATTIAHELGHNFGLTHDDSEKCTCDDPLNKCIMYASSSSTTKWSSCSKKDMEYAFEHGMDYCLRNMPEKLFDSPVCGNGFTELGEECDPGLEQFSKNPCCNATTCTLYKNATCAAGTCCDLNICHLKSEGNLCRDAQSQCDLPEYCTGESEYCPKDVFKANGLTCETKTGLAYCHKGGCSTHSDQCKLLWGPTGNNSNSLCYQRNTNGSKYAHCGYDLVSKNYTACMQEDYNCGVLHCNFLSEKLQFGYEPTSILNSFFVNSGGAIETCRSVTIDFGLTDVDPGLVFDGASCGTNKMCVNHKCVAVDTILTPMASKCEGCSGNGVCNSNGNCHCDYGYGGKHCEGGGLGGSIDSGPASPKYGSSIFARSVYVTFFGFIPLIAIISFYLYYNNDNIKKLCLRGRVVTRTQSPRDTNKPFGNGTANHTTIEMSNKQQTTSPPRPPAPSRLDLFGNFKGFSITPISQNPAAAPADSNGNNNTSPTSSNGIHSPPKIIHMKQGINGSINSSKPQYSSVSNPSKIEKKEEKLVKNENTSTSSIRSRIQERKQEFLNLRGSTRVSWAYPLSRPLPASPASGNGSEDESAESASSDTPLNNEGENKSPKESKSNLTSLTTSIKRPYDKIDDSPADINKQQKVRPISSPPNTLTSDYEKYEDANKLSSTIKNSFFASNSTLTRLANSIPFVRNSLRNSGYLNNDNENQTHHGSLSKFKPGKPINRDNIEISKPILQNEMGTKSTISNLISIVPNNENGNGNTSTTITHSSSDSDEKKIEEIIKSSNPRYANVPIEKPIVAAKPTLVTKPSPKILARIKQNSLPNQNQSSGDSPTPIIVTNSKPKIQRAQSMIQQPNRNSIAGNPNYNSLRRNRPSVPPPPRPPSTPPPPPPHQNLVNNNLNNTSKFASTFNPRSFLKFNTSSNTSTANSDNSSSKAPIAKLDDSPVSPANQEANHIYDIIAETPVEKSKDDLDCKNLVIENKIDYGGNSNKGSAESGPGGLLSEIISEIQTRNRESIYNSIDRRKNRKDNKLISVANNLNSNSSISPKPSPNSPKKAARSNAPPAVPNENKPSIVNGQNPLASLGKYPPKQQEEQKQKEPSSPKFTTKISSTSTPKILATTTSSSTSSTPSTTSTISTISQKPAAAINTASNYTFYKIPPLKGVLKNKQPSTTSTTATTTTDASTIPPPVPAHASVSVKEPEKEKEPAKVKNPPPVVKNLPPTIPKNCSDVPKPIEVKKNKSIDETNTGDNIIIPSLSKPALIFSPPPARPIQPKPVCTVNGIQKAEPSITTTIPTTSTTTTSPNSNPNPNNSYMAKINYFSTTCATKSKESNVTLMKPVQTIPKVNKENNLNEIIYAPSNISSATDTSDQNLSTIRRGGSYMNRTRSLDKHGSMRVKKNDGEKGGTLERKGIPVSNPIVPKNNSFNVYGKPQITKDIDEELKTKATEEVPIQNQNGTSGGTNTNGTGTGYKSFTPYLNRPTFSTFRPTNK